MRCCPRNLHSMHRQHFDDFAVSTVVSRTMSERRPILRAQRTGTNFQPRPPSPNYRAAKTTVFVVVMRDITERKRVEGELREKAEQIAVANERSRLARDLHDAVTQTLFWPASSPTCCRASGSATSMKARRRLEELRQLNRGALAEMRTLLLELRPAALLEANPERSAQTTRRLHCQPCAGKGGCGDRRSMQSCRRR